MKCRLNGKEILYPCSHNCPLYGDCVMVFDAEKKPKLQTNADRIRSMTNEELAEFLAEWNENQRAWRRDTYGELAAWLEES